MFITPKVMVHILILIWTKITMTVNYTNITDTVAEEWHGVKHAPYRECRTLAP